MMEMVCIVDNGNTYRVRKEENGCSIFGPGYFIEGNDIIFDILKIFSEEGIKEGYENLLKMYQVDNKILKKDLIEMAEEFEKENIFTEMASKIKEIIGRDLK